MPAEDDADYDPFAEAPTEKVKLAAATEKAQAAPPPKAKAPPKPGKAPQAVSKAGSRTRAAAVAAGEAPWSRLAPWRKAKRRGAAAKAQAAPMGKEGDLALPKVPMLQRVEFDPDNLAKSVKEITRQSQRLLNKVVKKEQKVDAKAALKAAPWRKKQPMAPAPKRQAASKAWAAKAWWLNVQAPWRRMQQPAPPPKKASNVRWVQAKGAGKGVMAKGVGKGVVAKAAGNGAMAKAKLLTKAAMAKGGGKAGKAAGKKAVRLWAAGAATAKASVLTKAGMIKRGFGKAGFASRVAVAKSKAMAMAMLKGKGKGKGKSVLPALRGPPPKAGGKAKGKGAAASAKAAMRQPWWAKQLAAVRMKQAKSAMPKRKGSGKGKGGPKSAADVAKNFLSRPNNKRLNDAASVAQEYFKHSEDDGQAAKKQKTEVLPTYTPEVLAKAPDNLQTCRSLLEFFDKKKESLTKPAVEIEIAADLKPRMARIADMGGIVSGLRRPGGWDARAKRIFDLSKLLESDESKAALKAAEERRAKLIEEIEKELLERGLNDKPLEELCKERAAWADDQTRREWIAWCARIARVKEAALIATAAEGEEKKKPSVPALGQPLSPLGVLEAMLEGKLAGS